MAFGITLALRAIGCPDPTHLIEHPPPVKLRNGRGFAKPRGMETYVNPDKDRTLPGKARRRARKAVTR